MAAVEGEWPTIPDDVIRWFRKIFADANLKVSEALLNAPALRETTLDDLFVSALTPHQAPRAFGSGATVRLDIHNIGGLRQWESWEIADIGLIAHVIRGRKIIASKVGLLQSKRLFPTVGEVDDEDEVGFRYGMNRWLIRDPAPTTMALTKKFSFDVSSKYKSLTAGSKQVEVIDDFTSKFGDSGVYYLMYNPPRIPLRVDYPIRTRKLLKQPPRIGARVYTAESVHGQLTGMADGAAPAFHQIYGHKSPPGGWRIEDWAAREFLRCRVGRRFSAKEDEIVASLVSRRSGPIASAIQVSIELSRE